MNTPAYTGIRLSYDQMVRDIERMLALAERFLQRESIAVLKELTNDLESIRTADAGKNQFLKINQKRGVKTSTTTAYRDSSKGNVIPVYGSLSFVWEIVNWEKGRRRQTSFDLVGIASTCIDVLKENGEVVARWQFEVGDATSPGCHFHASFNQQSSTEKLFPQWLKVPRLPGLLFSPMDGLDFLLGELFQTQWEQEISKDSQHRNGWADSQRSRLSRMLAWQAEQVRTNRVGTPWMSLKRAKPRLEVLLEK